MGVEIFVLFALFVLLMFAGVPVAYAMGLPSIVYFFFMQAGNTPIEFIPHTMTSPLFNFVLIALPAFLLSGRVMNSSGVTVRLYALAISLVGRFRGGLAYANIVASIIFSSMSGTAVGDAGGLGPVQMKMMTQAGYRKEFSAGISASSSVLGAIFPPSVAMVILGATAEISIGRLFLAGIFPGFIMAGALLANVFYQARFTEEGKAWPVEVVPLKRIPVDLGKAIGPILTPVIIVGGIVSGLVTPTEAAVLAIVYSILLGIIYRELTFKTFFATLADSAVTTGVFMFIIAVAGFFTWTVTQMGLPMLITNALSPLAEFSPSLTMLVLAAFFVFMGMFLDTTAAILLLTPTLMPIVNAVGLDPVHFGAVMVVALITGIVTPPMGICVFVMSDVARLPVKDVQKESMRYLPAMFIALLIIIFARDLVLFLPNLLMGT